MQFHNIVLWGNLAKIAAEFLPKGSKVLFEGELNTRVWEAQDGSKRYSTEIIANNMIMLNTKKQDGEGTHAPKENYAQPAQQNTANTTNQHNDEISIEDIPF